MTLSILLIMLIIKHNTGFMEWMNKIPFTSSQAIMRITDANRAGLHWAPPHTTWLGARCWETQCVIDGVSVLRVPANLSDSLQQPSGIKKKKKRPTTTTKNPLLTYLTVLCFVLVMMIRSPILGQSFLKGMPSLIFYSRKNFKRYTLERMRW